MERSIVAEKDDELRKAYREMLDGCLAHPAQWNWYAMWMIETSAGVHIGDLCFKGLESGKNPEIGYGILEEGAYDQIPTGSNWNNDTNFFNTVRYCAERIAPCRLKGFLQTPWCMTTPQNREKLLESIRQVVEAKRWWDETHLKGKGR